MMLHQRASGTVALSWKRREQRTVIDRLRQEGCLKLRFPRLEVGGWPCAVTLNSSGGVAAGDQLHVSVLAARGTRATIASQAAERFYRALPGQVSAVTNEVMVEPGATLEWLPQETILFDGCALRRRLSVELAADACFVGLESLVFGRSAMGETVRTAELDDLIEITRGGKRLLHDRIRLSGPAAALLRRPAVGGGAAAIGTLVHVAPDAETRLEAVRGALAGYDAGASAWDGILVARIVAENGACLRRAVVAGLAVLREGRTLPRVWLC